MLSLHLGLTETGQSRRYSEGINMWFNYIVVWKVTNFDIWYPIGLSVLTKSTVGSRFTTIHFYDPCPVGPSTPNLWCITVTTQASFLYLVRFQLSSTVHVFLLFLFQYSSFKLIVIFPPMTSIKKTEKKKKSKQLTLHSFLMSSEPRPGPFSTK